MNSSMIWDNLVAYSLQIGLLVGLAAFVPAVLRLRLPAGRLAYWHALLGACLLLPALRPWKQNVITLSGYVPPTPPPAILTHTPPERFVDWIGIALLVLAGGMALRLAWLAVGLWRLSSLRRHAVPLRHETSWSVEAEIRISDAISSPVTFGYFRPTVLLPANFDELEAPTQEAILCHEVLHVRRKDWLFTVMEEVIRSVFWFHPAIWWLLGEIGLAREQVVDREVVEMTRSREQYVDALLAIAGATPRLDLAPAPLFLRKRHLKQRVVSIMREVRMSKTRSISSLAAGLGILAAACWLVTATFPLAAAPQMVTDGPGVTVDAGGSVLHRDSIQYPAAARSKRIQGVVTVEASVDGSGNVVDTRVLSGPVELRRAAQQSVLNWHFAMDSAASTRKVTVNFDLTGVPEIPQPTMVATGRMAAPQDAATRAAAEAQLQALRNQMTEQQKQVVTQPLDQAQRQQAMARLNELQASMSAMQSRMGPPIAEGRRLASVDVFGLTENMKNDLTSRMGVRPGDTMTAESLARARRAAMEFDEHIQFGTAYNGTDEMRLTLTMPGARAGVSSGGVLSGVISSIPSPPDPNMPKRITIGGNVQQAKLISQAKPAYPPLAKQARISGVVHLQVIIAKDGTMQDIKVISGHPLLIPAAIEAVKNWVYQPTLLNGDPVEVSTQIDVNFTLSDELPQQQQQQ
ncbi:MAG: M56 family metallopeptidase [Candidatus Solibacter sp.]